MYLNGDGDFPEAALKTVPSDKLLIDGKVDMIIVPYASSDILSLAENAGVDLEFYPIAAEALVFLRQKKIRLKTLP